MNFFRAQISHSRKRLASFAFVIGQVFLLSSVGNAAEVYPSEDWEDDYDPIASPDAIPGGKINIGFGPYPASFNYFLQLSTQAGTVMGLMYDQLMTLHPVSLDYQPMIARKIEISDDQKTFTVHINPNAHWSDGNPITAHDLAFTFDTILEPKNLVAGVIKLQASEFENREVLDDLTMRFTAKRVHWRNLLSLATTQVFPKHVWEGQDFNKIDFEFPVVSGRYRIAELKEGISLKLARRSDWWLEDQKRYQNLDNFDEIQLRFNPDRDLDFELFKKGELDYFVVGRASDWKTKTDGEPYAKNWIVKQEIYNHRPISFSGLVMNMRREPFDDLRVRKALAHLFDRRRMNETIMYNAYFMLHSFEQGAYDEKNPNTNEIYEFDKDKARRLLSEAGWQANPQTGYIERNGKRFVINFLLSSSTMEKFLAIYREDLKDVGIELNVEIKDWAAWTKDMDEFSFDMTWAGWRPSLFDIPDQLWLSTQADVKASSNYAGFRNTEVDALIEKQRTVFDVGKRKEITRQIDRIVYGEVPYVLAWGLDYMRLLYWNKFGTPPTVLDKYKDDDLIMRYWWADPDLEAELQETKDSGQSMPPKPTVIRFDEVFGAN